MFFFLLFVKHAICSMQYWVRRQNVLAHRWDMLEYEEKEDELPGFRVSDGGARYGFYEPHGEWIDLERYSEKVLPKHGPAFAEWIPKSRLFERGKLPGWCFGIDTDQTAADAANTMWWRRVQRVLSMGVMVLVASVSRDFDSAG
jgi:hypothetical protein